MKGVAMRNAISLLILAGAIVVGMRYGFWSGVVAFLVLAAAHSLAEGGNDE